MITREVLRKMIHGAYVYKLDGGLLGRIAVDSPRSFHNLSDRYVFFCHEDKNQQGTLPRNSSFGYQYGYCISFLDDHVFDDINLMAEERKISPQDVVSSILINILQSEVSANFNLIIKFESQLTLYDIC